MPSPPETALLQGPRSVTDSVPIHEYSAEHSPRGFLYHAPRVFADLPRTILAESVLTRHLFKQQVIKRFQGTILGPLWVLIHPLFLFAIYFVIFGMLFGRGGNGASAVYALYLFSGITLYQGLLIGTTQALDSITGNANLVKKLAFPCEVLPLAPIISEMSVAALSFVVVLIAGAATGGLPYFSWPILLLPINFVIMTVLGLGLGYFLANLAVYYRDIRQFYGIVGQALFFVSPNFWQPDLLLNLGLGDRALTIAQLNPAFPILIAQRQIFGILPATPSESLGVSFGVFQNLALGASWAVVALLVGYGTFMSQRRKFADLV